MIRVKILLTRLSIRKLEETPSQLILTFDEATKVSPKKIVALVQRGEGRYQVDSGLPIDRGGGAAFEAGPFWGGQKAVASLDLI